MDSKIRLPEYFPVACHTDQIGAGSTFVVIRGMKDDGIRHIPKALQQGARTIVIGTDIVLDPEIAALIAQAGATLERVNNPRRELARRAAQALNYPAAKLKIIGITGTKGKTTTSFLVEHILKTAGHKTALIGTVENHILGQTFSAPLTTPQPDYIHVFLSACARAGVEYVVMETSAQAFTLHRVDGIMFDAGIFTNFSQEHAEFYATNGDYFAAKKAILTHLKPGAPLILNADDARVAALAASYKNTFFFASTGACGADLQATLELSSTAGITGRLRYTEKTRKNTDCKPETVLPVNGDTDVPDCGETYAVTVPALMGDFNLANSAAAALCAHLIGIISPVIKEALRTFGGVPGRLNRYELPGRICAFIDYAHTPSSFEAVLGTLRQLTDHLVVVFGAGGDRDPIKRPQMGAIAARIADCIILTTDNPRSENPQDIIRAINTGIEPKHADKVHIELDRERAIEHAYDRARAGSIIALLGKGPDEYQLVAGIKTYFSERKILERLMCEKHTDTGKRQ